MQGGMAMILDSELMATLGEVQPEIAGEQTESFDAANSCGCTGNCGQSCSGGCDSGCTGSCGRSCSGSSS
jgi:hypothetical protein